MNKIKEKPQLGPILTLNHKCTQFLKDEIGPNMKPVTEGWTYVVCLFDFLHGLSVCVDFFFGCFYFRYFQLWTTIFDWTFAQRERERERYGRRAWSGNYLQGLHGASTNALVLNHQQGHVHCHGWIIFYSTIRDFTD